MSLISKVSAVAFLVAFCSKAWSGVLIGDDGYAFFLNSGQRGYNSSSGNIDVRYGVDSRWTAVGPLAPGQSIMCTPTDFGTDPASGTVKYCYWRASVAGVPSGAVPTGSGPASADPYAGVPAPVVVPSSGPGLSLGGQCFRTEDELRLAANENRVSSLEVVAISNVEILPAEIKYIATVMGSTGSFKKGVRAPRIACEPRDFEHYQPQVMAWLYAMVAVLCVRLIYTQIFRKESYS